MKFIDNTRDLEHFCKNLMEEEFITVDLEFIREKTYYAKLCLIQIGSKSESAIIDPLASGMDLSSFFALMQNEKIIKVFHSGRQDIEIIYHLSGNIPNPIFDTQIIAQVCGFGEAASYESLVNVICNKELDKSSRLTDWSKRPLNEAQLNYALSDVTHLVDIYLFLFDKMQKLGRAEWIKDEMEVLTSVDTYDVNPYEVWKKIKHRSHNVKFLTILRELAAWREKRAIRKNTPRQSLIKDDMLLNIASVNPHSVEELAEVRGMKKDIVNGKLADEILEVIKYCDTIKRKDYVELPKEPKLNVGCSSLCELLRLLLKIRAQAEGVIPRLIASDDDLKKFSAGDDDASILQGWRRGVFGDYALRLRAGELHIAYDPQAGKIDFISL